MLAAAKDEAVFSLAASLFASENSRLGSATSTNELHRAFGFPKSNTATSLHVCLYDFFRGSRSTGKERDAESGLDYFGARYYGSALGRFSSPDETLVDQAPQDPQSWNLYSYARNNPLSNTDPDGQACQKTTYTLTTSDGRVIQKSTQSDTSTCAAMTYLVLAIAVPLQQTSDLASGLINLSHNFVKPHDPRCLASAAAKGGAIGTGIGMLAGGISGVGTGPGLVATAAAGGLIAGPPSAAIGYGVGLMTCMVSNGEGGGGYESSETRFSAKFKQFFQQAKKIKADTPEETEENIEKLLTAKGWSAQKFYTDPGGTVFKAEFGNEAVQVNSHTGDVIPGHWLGGRFLPGD